MTTAAQRNAMGTYGEDLAARHLVADGMVVLDRNWRCPEGELDLVVDFPGEMVFVEVKARRHHGAEAVTPRQWARIGAAASRYLAEHTDGTKPCRFDLALVDRAGRMERIENARSFDGG